MSKDQIYELLIKKKKEEREKLSKIREECKKAYEKYCKKVEKNKGDLL